MTDTDHPRLLDDQRAARIMTAVKLTLAESDAGAHDDLPTADVDIHDAYVSVQRAVARLLDAVDRRNDHAPVGPKASAG